ncbi:MAG: MBOAT family protein [Butyrivibrio sp.]|nr:MBOAT family protein [Butyrivibrio sp.]
MRAAQVFLLVMSLWFYGYQTPAYLWIIICSVVVNYGISVAMRHSAKQAARRLLFIMGILLNIGILGYYKYLSFFLWNINHFFGADFVIRSILLPLGISFYTIQQISYLIDCYHDREIRYGFIEYALYVTYFPQLVAGPIVYHTELIPQFEQEGGRRPDAERLVHGLCWFTLGLSKKVFLADRLGSGVTWAFLNIDQLGTLDVWLVMLSYTLQIYFDFSGYSDMACGIARLFGFTLPQNFNSPYQALSIRDFWRRWHMTLTRFLTRYIYIPLGGNRRGQARTILNTLMVFLISGIWHGANYTFILWGVLHGGCMILSRRLEDMTERIPKPLRWAGTFLIVNILWLLFRSDGVRQWMMLVTRMFVFDGRGVSEALMSAYDAHVPPGLLLLAALALCLGVKNNYVRSWRLSGPMVAGCAMLLGLCLLTLNRVSVFLYFNF